jgi:uncharacterized DUF497 family protein
MRFLNKIISLVESHKSRKKLPRNIRDDLLIVKSKKSGIIFSINKPKKQKISEDHGVDILKIADEFFSKPDYYLRIEDFDHSNNIEKREWYIGEHENKIYTLVFNENKHTGIICLITILNKPSKEQIEKYILFKKERSDSNVK